MTAVGEAELGFRVGGAARLAVWGVGKGRGNAEGAFTRQRATAAVGDPLGYAIGHKLLGTG